MNYYNEFDQFAAQWLRNLIEAELIPPGHVDERSIKEVQPNDLAGYIQCHFFAGIAGWPLALEIAGWPTDAPVWTGSCPCQPFSAAGKRKGIADDRHLWPEFYRLIAKCRPATVFGEQVASKDGLQWLDGVFADLESTDYACGAADLCAAGVRSPNLRQRLWWVGELGDANSARQRARRGPQRCERGEAVKSVPATGVTAGGLGIARGDNLGRVGRAALGAEAEGDCGRAFDGAGRVLPGSAGPACWMGNTERDGLRVGGREAADEPHQSGYWSLFELVPCGDGATRKIEPGSFPLAHGIPRRMGQGKSALARMARPAGRNRVGRLKGYGNSINPYVAAEFIRSYIEAAT